MARPKIAVFSGPTATIQNSEPLVTSNKARARHGLLWHWLVGRSASEPGRLRHGDRGRPPLWHRLLRRSASESGTLCPGDGAMEGATAPPEGGNVGYPHNTYWFMLTRCYNASAISYKN
jgi:hypothetical protein